jgi:GTP-binding protein
MLIDEVEIKYKSGDGGDGLAHLYHDGQRPKGGPDGGNGGKGGDIFAKAVSDISKLSLYRYRKEFSAEDGQPGGINKRTGKDGQDLTLEVPVGTQILFDNGTSVDLDQPGQTVTLAQGGRGGKGNFMFRSATNQTPTEFTRGQKKPWRSLRFKLKLIADIGLVGLPNAGKTSLLNELTTAAAKVANYAFTTLEPNLGVTKGNYVIADIPGLIEGASQGKGLGFQFLKHIERTRIIAHCLAADSPSLASDYQVIRQELENYGLTLSQKPEVVILTKSDLLSPAELESKMSQVGAVFAVSIIDDLSLKNLSDFLTKQLQQLQDQASQ